jgi:DNA-binding transcriptional MerR regulator
MAKPLLSSAEMCERAGVTYRQLDNWARKGYVTPAQPAAGCGTQRRWSGDELDRVRELAARSAALRGGLIAGDG